MEFALVLVTGFAVGLLIWPARMRLGGSPTTSRGTWAFMFACNWPLLIIASLWAVASLVRRRR
jgi:hypothetical protein